MGRGMKTLFQVGKGFVADEPEAPAAEESPPEAPGGALSETAEAPEALDSESRAAAPETAPGRAESPVHENVRTTGKPKGTARGRRWGAPQKQG